MAGSIWSTSRGILEEDGGGSGGAGEQKGFDQRDSIALQALGGVQDRKIDGQALCAESRTIAKDQFPEDDRMAQGLFRIVIRGRHVVDLQESKELVIVALGIDQPLAEAFGFGMVAGFFANAEERSVEFGNFGARLGKGEFAIFPLAGDLAGFGDQVADLLAEAQVGRVLLASSGRN